MQPFTNQLSGESNEVTLSVPTAGTATGLIASDATNNYDASDFRVIFDKADNENLVAEYKVFVKKSAASFSLADAETNTNGITIAKTGEKIIQTLLATAKDTDGDDIAMNTPYRFYVMSMGEGNALNSLSTTSNEVTLSDVLSLPKELTNSIKLFNNNGELLIQSDIVINSVNIINIEGKSILNKLDNNVTNVNISNLNNGMYIVNLGTTEGTISKKFIK